MSDFEVEKGIDIPQQKHSGAAKYPWRDMEPGDSFLIACTPDEHRKMMRRIQPSAFAAGRRLGKKFIARTLDEGIRVWCVSAEPSS